MSKGILKSLYACTKCAFIQILMKSYKYIHSRSVSSNRAISCKTKSEGADPFTPPSKKMWDSNRLPQSIFTDLILLIDSNKSLISSYV